VLLRPFQDGDAEESARVWTPELRHMYGGSRHATDQPTVESRQRMIERIVKGGEHHFAIETDGRYIGFAALKLTDEEEGNASYRIGIESPEYWSRGYGTEVTRLMLRYAFETLELHRVHLRVTAYNVRARRCYEKAGFRVEGVLRKSFQVDREWQNDVLMAILREEWEQRRDCPSDGLCALGPEHIDEVLALWSKTDFWPHTGEDTEFIARALERNRDFAVACRVSGELVGTAIGGSDGFRGWIYRVAVHPGHRRRGIASVLVGEVERMLAAAGVRDASHEGQDDPALAAQGRELERAWADLDVTVEEGLDALKTLCTMHMSLSDGRELHQIPTPRDQSGALLDALAIKLPPFMAQRNIRVATKHKLPPRRSTR
jgi:RimJ/RimL family protein N-acetyltransferase